MCNQPLYNKQAKHLQHLILVNYLKNIIEWSSLPHI